MLELLKFVIGCALTVGCAGAAIVLAIGLLVAIALDVRDRLRAWWSRVKWGRA